MMAIIINGVIGFILGGLVGVIIICLMRASREADELAERIFSSLEDSDE